MKILIDRNLSPEWVEWLNREGWQAVHWSSVGDSRAADNVIMEWARGNDYIVFTHDLDFGILLATTRAEGPSVIQVRTQNIMPQNLGKKLAQVLRTYEPALKPRAPL